MSPARNDQIAALFRRRARDVMRLVRARANVPAPIIEDACQTAWERLCAHAEVELHDAGVVQWLVLTATREAWKRGRIRRDQPAGGRSPDPEHDDELQEPAADVDDVCELVIARELHRQRVARLSGLTPRERRFVGLHAIGLSYSEVGIVGDASRRTVERQILRARRKLGLKRAGFNAASEAPGSRP